MSVAKDSLFGIKLSAHGISLLEKVEELYDTKIREEFLPENEQAGNSKVASDGTPIVLINPKLGLSEDVIVHELYHFIQRYNGFPVIEWLIPSNLNNEANRMAFQQLNMQVHDPILHYIFFPTIRQWGINPNGSVERQTKEMLDNGNLSRTFDTMDNKAVAFYCYMLRLTFEDNILMNDLIEIIKNKGKEEGINLGNEMSQKVINADPKTPQHDIDLVLNTLNLFYKGQYLFKLHQWKHRMLGKHKQTIAPIEIKLI